MPKLAARLRCIRPLVGQTQLQLQLQLQLHLTFAADAAIRIPRELSTPPVGVDGREIPVGNERFQVSETDAQIESGESGWDKSWPLTLPQPTKQTEVEFSGRAYGKISLALSMSS